jgi:hypothetical protein
METIKAAPFSLMLANLGASAVVQLKLLLVSGV